MLLDQPIDVLDLPPTHRGARGTAEASGGMGGPGAARSGTAPAPELAPVDKVAEALRKAAVGTAEFFMGGRPGRSKLNS
jgi:hypothetical protein